MIATGTADASGNFTIPLLPALTNGEKITAVVTDPAGNTSAGTTATAPDVTSPNIPTQVVISASGDLITGKAEENSFVKIFDEQGGLIAEGVASSEVNRTGFVGDFFI